MGIGLATSLYSCNKEEKLDYTLQNYDTFESGAIDEWIARNMTDPYNIEVIYRYQRNMHDINKNIAPVEEAKVIPQMEVVKKGFLDVYADVAGLPFIQEYTPKQFVLFGSGDYDPDGSVKGGTADGGRRITLYGVNGLNTENPNAVLGNLQVVHHEFTHIINQLRMIPPDFGLVCVGDYYANWTHWENTPELAQSLGFITPYSRKSIGEDFAETLSHLVVAGQLYYDQYAYEAGEEAYQKLKRKETIVRDYMAQYFNIDVTKLQMAFQKVMEEQYHSQAFSFMTAVNDKSIEAMLDMDIRDAWGVENTLSDKQLELFSTILDGFGDYDVKGIELQMRNTSKATLRIPFGNSSGTWYALYDLDIQNQGDGTYKIKKSTTQGTDDGYNYGTISYVIKDVQPLLDYLASTSFSFDWGILGQQIAENYLQYVTIQDVNNKAFGLTAKVSVLKY